MPTTVTYTSRTPWPSPIREEYPGSRPYEGGKILRAHFLSEANDLGIILMDPGLFVSRIEGGVENDLMTGSQLYWAPTTPGALYGPGTDTPHGIVPHQIDFTHFDQIIHPVTQNAVVHEEECYCAGGAKGDVPAAIKTALTSEGIRWRSS